MKQRQKISIKRTFTQADFDEFARLSLDDNPIHVDPVFSARTKFGRTVAHGMMLYGVICGLLSQHFPGAAQIEQELRFPAPTFVGDLMTISAEIVEQTRDGRIHLKTTISNPDGVLTCDGNAILKWDVS